MTKIKFKKDCSFNGNLYFVDDELDITTENVKEVWKLNEKGYIFPLTLKEFTKIKKELIKQEEKQNGNRENY